MTDFARARIKFTLIYVLIITGLIAASFWMSVIQNISQNKKIRELELVESAELLVRTLNVAQSEFIKEVTKLNLLLLIPSTALAYILSDLTLKPIERNSKQKEEFAAETSHELRTPITNMRLEISNFKQEDAYINNKIVQDFTESIEEETIRMQNTIDALMSLVSIERNIDPIYFDVKEVIEDMTKKFYKSAQEKHLKFLTNIATTDTVIRARKAQIETLVSVIIDNAVKYSYPNNTVYIDLTDTKNTLYLKVLNTGPKISEENINRIFNKFFREKNNLTNSTTGSGLGLPLAKKLAEHNDVNINVVSNKRTTFTLTIPKL